MPIDPEPARIAIAIGDLPLSFAITDRDGSAIWTNGTRGVRTSYLAPLSGRVVLATTDLNEQVLLHIPYGKTEPLDLLLLQEAEHRSRNLISLVVSLAHQSLAAIEGNPLVASFIDRLRSLDAVARIGCEIEGDLCPFDRIVRQVTQRLDDPSYPKITITGPDVSIAARWAHLLAIVLHELTVNALRHGALSVPEGRVDLRWTIIRTDHDLPNTLLLNWRERDGPMVAAQVRTGFGTRFLRDLIGSNRRCTAGLKMLSTGLVYELSIRLGSNELHD